MNRLSPQLQAELRQRLLAGKRRLEQLLADNGHDGLRDAQRDNTGELSAYDNHPADLGTETFERGKDVALLELEEQRLRRIDEALQAMDDGEYGRCATCGRPIAAERLLAIPETRYCAAHSPQQKPSERRPVEERLMQPPFGRTSMDEQSSYAGFDGEDAWQIVESWGSSDSPALAESPSFDYDDPTFEAQENEGYVEEIENFLATDITGRHVSVVRGKQYRAYLAHGEGEPLLEPDDQA